jgi:hypothetical protein
MRQRVGGLLVLLMAVILAILCCQAVAISPDEATFLGQFYAASPAVLGSLAVPWSSNTSDACGIGGGSAWTGLVCTPVDEHIESLILPGLVLDLELPDSISRLIDLETLYASWNTIETIAGNSSFHFFYRKHLLNDRKAQSND